MRLPKLWPFGYGLKGCILQERQENAPEGCQWGRFAEGADCALQAAAQLLEKLPLSELAEGKKLADPADTWLMPLPGDGKLREWLAAGIRQMLSGFLGASQPAGDKGLSFPRVQVRATNRGWRRSPASICEHALAALPAGHGPSGEANSQADAAGLPRRHGTCTGTPRSRGAAGPCSLPKDIPWCVAGRGAAAVLLRPNSWLIYIRSLRLLSFISPVRARGTCDVDTSLWPDFAIPLTHEASR